MRTVFIAVGDEFAEHRFDMGTKEDQHPVETLAADGADEPFGERVRTRRSNGRPDGPDAVGPEYLVETGGELGVPVPDQELLRVSLIDEHAAQGASLLRHRLPPGLR